MNKVSKRISRTMFAVSKSSDADLILLSGLCQLEVEYRMHNGNHKIDYAVEICKIRDFIKNGYNNQ